MKLSEVEFTPSDLQRFWSRVEKNSPDKCWPWVGTRWKTPGFEYGMLSVGGTSFGAHRISLKLKLKGSFVDDLQACHACDNPTCVNPDHLFQGTHSDNMKDANSKGRRTNAFKNGQQHPTSKLTDLCILFIRRSPKRQRELAELFGVNQQTISKIQNHQRWGHVNG